MREGWLYYLKAVERSEVMFDDKRNTCVNMVSSKVNNSE